MKLKTSVLACLSIAIVFVTGCASTIESRIQERQAAFDAYAPEVQTRLKQKHIAIGDDMDAVWIAFGEPTERKYRIQTTGRTDIWIYKYLATREDLYPAVRTVHHDIGGRVRTSYYIDDTPYYTWKESLRVEFKDGRVVSILGDS